MQDGSVSEPWKYCTTEYLGAVATTRVIILPIGLSLATIISLVFVWQAAGLNPLMVAIPAIILILCSIFLFFSIFWVTAIVVSLASLFAIGSGHKGGTAFLIAIVIQVFALAVVVGGLGLGSFFFNNAAIQPAQLFFNLGSGGPTAHSTTWQALATCSQYYDYFFVDASSTIPNAGGNNNVPYDADPDLRYRDYCSEGWYTYVGLVADIIVTIQILMLATTGVAYLKGGSSSGGKSVN
jgi:energy-coupling factor transporter transmembrane protein EcfT